MSAAVDDIERVERRVKLHDVRVFMSVVQAGSMGKAAIRLRTSQSAVSRTIADLERSLGVRLFDRSKTGIEATPYGRALMKRGIAVFDELRHGIKELEFLADPTAGEAKVAASIAVAVSLASAVIDRLSMRCPRLAFDLLAADTVTATRALEERKVDLAIVHIIEQVDRDHMNVEILWHEPHVVVAGARSPWARKRKLKLADLMNEPWALPPTDSPFGSVVLAAFRANGLDLPRTIVTSTLPARNTLLATGRYLTMVPRVVLSFPARNADLKRLPIELPMTRRPLGIVTLKNRTLSPVAQLVIDCARALAKSVAKRK
jgi:DNA-binding transcriptional LysR family regulator